MRVTCEMCESEMEPVVNTAVLFSLLTTKMTTIHYVCLSKKCNHEQDIEAHLAVVGGKKIRLGSKRE